MGSGGVGILIHERLLNICRLHEIINLYEGILVIIIKHKIVGFKIAFIACYLLPENSSYGKEPDFFL